MMPLCCLLASKPASDASPRRMSFWGNSVDNYVDNYVDNCVSSAEFQTNEK
jgi:hypothetical protein